MKLFLVLPIYDEEDNLERLLNAVDDACKDGAIEYLAICVNDGSKDDSGQKLLELSKSFSIHIITHLRNRGLGETIRDGFEAAADLAAPGDVIARMDADCTHEPRYLPSLIAALDQGADVAIASRFPPGGGEVGLAANRKWISRIANLAFRICFPLGGVREYTCGYRAYRASIIQKALEIYGNSFIQLRGFGFCCTVEKLLKLKAIGARLHEVPFVLRYDLKQGQSKMIFNITMLGYAVMVIMYQWPWGGWRTTAKKRLSPR